MAKYLSNRQQNLKIGIVSYTENKTVLEVTGNVGIKTADTQGYELYVNGDANISGIVSATAFFGNGGNLEDLITEVVNVSLTKLEGLEVKEEGVGIGTTFTAINFVGTGVTATASGNTAVITITQPVSGIGVRYNDINIGTGITSLNFSGTGISSVTSNNISGMSTITVDLQSNLDGGTPTTNYGGIDSIEGGGI